jgi:hypothetical protein
VELKAEGRNDVPPTPPAVPTREAIFRMHRNYGAGDKPADNYATKLVATLSRPRLPAAVSTARVSAAIGTEWRKVSCRLLARPGVKLALAVLGWRYRPARGCRGGHFVRVSADRTPEVERALGLSWATIRKALLWYSTGRRDD